MSPATDADAPPAAHFDFVAARRPVIVGAAGGVAVVALFFAWAYASGRLANADATWLAVVLACTAGAVLVVVPTTLARNRRAALAAGRIELDAAGIRHRRGDGSPGFDATWDAVQRASVDRRTSQILLQLRDAAPVVLGGGAGHVAIAGLDALERAIASRVPLEPAGGVHDRPAARRILLGGAAVVLAGAALYAANAGLAIALDWTRFTAVMPTATALVGALMLAAGARIHRGRGPLVSPLYHPGYPRVLARMVAVFALVNFALLALFNAL